MYGTRWIHTLPRDIFAKANVRNEAGIRTYFNNFAFRAAHHWTTCNAKYMRQKLNVAAMHLMEPLFLSTPLFFSFYNIPNVRKYIKKMNWKIRTHKKTTEWRHLISNTSILIKWKILFYVIFLMIFCQIIVHFMPFKMMAPLTGII